MVTVVKRDGREVRFDANKIKDAVYAAAKATKHIEISHELNMAMFIAQEVAEAVAYDINTFPPENNKITVEEIQDMVEEELMRSGNTDIAKCYILYREKRSQIRNRKSKTMETMRELTFSDSKDNDIKRENGNIDGNTAMGLMLKYGSEVSKEFALDNLIDPEVAAAHRSGDIHIHDLDFYAMGTLTCIQHPLAETLRRGFSTGHGTLRPPKSIRAFSALACIEIQACQNDMHGGQAVNAWDYDLALGVHYSFEKALIANLQKYIADLQLLPEDFDMSVIKELVRKYRTDPDEPIHYAEHPTDELRDVLTLVVRDCQDLSEYGIGIMINSEDMIIQQSIDDTIEETYQAMEAAIHNLNTLHCLPGSEEIWVSDKQQGKTRLISMKELDETFSPDRYEAYSINMDTAKVELKPIIASARKDNNRDLVTVTNKMGAKVTVTTNHKMVTVNKQTGKLYKAVPDEITTTIMPNVADDTYFAADITKREYCNSGDEYVYDISVKDNENFMTKNCIFVSNSRAGSQVPFSSINFGTDTSDAGRLIIRKTLEAVDAGMGNGETAIFPISIFKVYDGINFKPGDPNYDLYRYAMEVTARRLFPNFVFGDAPFNYQYYRPGHPETEIVAMGCRTRVIGNVNGPEIVPKRGNCSFTTINLPRLGIKHGKVSEGGLDLDAFFADLDKQLELVEKELLDRYEYQGKKKVKNFPFLMGEGLWMDSETLGSEDTLESVIKHGTLSIGFIGLAECLVALIGKHHGESAEAQELGLKIIKHMRDYTDEATKRTHLNFSVLATPSEGLSGRFVRIDKKVYGIIPGVTDREYYTNSMHCPVYYPMNAFDKIEIEAAYHPYCNAGHICYVELDGDVTKNIDAIEEILAWMKECGIGYGSLNHPVDYDPICGYVGIIGDTCPRCGRKEYEGVPIQRLKKLGVWKEYNSKYIGYTGDLQEEEDRIPNLYVTKKED